MTARWIGLSLLFVPFLLAYRLDESVRVGSAANIFEYRLEKNSSVFETLKNFGLSQRDASAFVQTIRPHINLRRIPAGLRFQVYSELGPIRQVAQIALHISDSEFYKVIRAGDEWKIEKTVRPVETRVVSFSGIVKNSLWESAVESQMDPELIVALADVFAWQLDFTREVRQNDRWRLTVEQRLIDGKPNGWGTILAAEYQNSGRMYTAVHFNNGYFAPDGSSLKKIFLKSPLRFSRVSSRFNHRRFHPILKTRRPHLGVDYAASTGTPVMAVGDGEVSFAGHRGGGGLTLTLRHNSTYQTAYKHLSGFAPRIRKGTFVRQGQVIGYVGSTGLSTGPHLHFEFYENGRFVDPLGKKFPSADPISNVHRVAFQKEAQQKLRLLPIWFYPGVTLTGPIVQNGA